MFAIVVKKKFLVNMPQKQILSVQCHRDMSSFLDFSGADKISFVNKYKAGRTSSSELGYIYSLSPYQDYTEV